MKAVRRESRPTLSQPERDALLHRDVSAILAFVDAEGFPRMVPCWYLWDGESFYVTSERDKFHVRCLTRNSRASICVEAEDVVTGQRRSNRQVKAVGRVELFDDDAAGSWWRRIRARYLGQAGLPDSMRLATSRIVLKLTPERLSAHGGDLIIESPPLTQE